MQAILEVRLVDFVLGALVLIQESCFHLPFLSHRRFYNMIS
jgi:hypothetical protein